MAGNPFDEVTAPVDGMDLDQDESPSMPDKSASTLAPVRGQTRRERRRVQGRQRVERLFGDRMRGNRGDAYMSTEGDPEQKRFKAIERLPEFMRISFKTGVSFLTAKPIEHSVIENLCHNLSLQGTLGLDSSRLFSFARALVNDAHNIRSYYPSATYKGSIDERRSLFFQAVADRMKWKQFGKGLPSRIWDENPITKQTCEVMLTAFVEARMAYLRMDIDGSEKPVQEGTWSRKTTQFIKELDRWVSFIQKIENKKQQEEDHELADAMGDLGMGKCN